MNSIAEDNLMHYGTPRHSGRYPWGSGDNPYQRSGDFLSRIEELKTKDLPKPKLPKQWECLRLNIVRRNPWQRTNDVH